MSRTTVEISLEEAPMHRSYPAVLAVFAVTAACTPDQKTPTEAPAIQDDQASELLQRIIAGKPGDPVPNLAPEELRFFGQGMAVFSTVFTPATGLGPLFNSTSCAQCHNNPTLGGYGDSVEIHTTAYHPGAPCQTLDANGGPVVQQHATPALEAALHITSEPMPAGGTGIGRRTTPLIFGLGLLDAVSDYTIKGLAQVRQPFGVRGRAAVLADGSVGRFGRKASVSSLDAFNAGAFFNEMGITNRLNPVEGTVAGRPLPRGVDRARDPELDAASLAATNAFVRFLAPVAPLPLTEEGKYGWQLFSLVGCATCHTPTLQTGPSRYAALKFKRINAYSDLLLHDMGDQEADICNGVATPREFRTQPLMGMQFLDMFMHDGESATIEEAVQRHGGEASTVRDRFQRLSPRQRAAIVSFVSAL
jgi:CxxC motif-containing protein (DUF1111 family)